MGIPKHFYYLENSGWSKDHVVKTDDLSFLYRLLMYLNPVGPIYVIFSFRSYFTPIALEAQRILTGRSLRHAGRLGGMKPQKGLSIHNSEFKGEFLALFADLANDEIRNVRRITPKRIGIEWALDHQDNRSKLKLNVCLDRLAKASKPKTVLDLDYWISEEDLVKIEGVTYRTAQDEADRLINIICLEHRADGVPASAIASVGADADEETFISEDACRFFLRLASHDLQYPFHLFDKAGIRSHPDYPFKTHHERLMAAWGIGTDFTQLKIDGKRYNGLHGVGYATLKKGGFDWWLESPLDEVKKNFEQSEMAVKIKGKGKEASEDFDRNLDGLINTCQQANLYWNETQPLREEQLFSKSKLRADFLAEQASQAPPVEMASTALKSPPKRGKRAPSGDCSAQDAKSWCEQTGKVSWSERVAEIEEGKQ